MRKTTVAATLAAALLVLAGNDVAAQDATRGDSVVVYTLEPITVEGRVDDLTGLATSSSVGFVGARDLRVRPLARVGELLEVVPGMILTQHSGSGKSNQMFVRGFNLDHGTDFSTRVEGMPVNLVSHAHGQGYTDLNFVIPELIENIEYSLGTHHAHIGDFGSAGGAEMRLRRTFDAPVFATTAGAYGQRRVFAGGSVGEPSDGALLFGAEAQRYDGPWDVPEAVRKWSGAVRYSKTGRTNTWSLLAMAYDNSWNSSDQIPDRAVESGLIGRFGQIDPTLGGSSSRVSLSGGWTRSTSTSSQHIDVYAIRYDLDLFSNFTYLLGDGTDGDQIRQVDDGRTTMGANLGTLHPLRAGGLEHTLEVGSQIRGDRADLTLAQSRRRANVATIRMDDVNQWSAGVFTTLTTQWSPAFRSELGLRWDGYAFDVESDRTENSGSSTAGVVSPKASLAWLAAPSVEVYASGGLGFHSNDARGVLTVFDPIDQVAVDPVDPIAGSWGGEFGLRLTPTSGWVSTATAWAINLDSELLYVGDAGQVEPSDGSRRVGLTVANFYRIDSEWAADLDVSFTRARFQDVAVGEDRIPGALEQVLAMGVAREPVGDGVFGSIRLRHFGAYPLIESGDVRAEPSSMVNAVLGFALGDLRFSATLLNATDEQDSDIQYLYASRLEGEPLAGVEDVHFHPFAPRRVNVTVAWGLGR
ncbi:MAG: TonB-dependent receptor [Gemmatimonadota bacterium]